MIRRMKKGDMVQPSNLEKDNYQIKEDGYFVSDSQRERYLKIKEAEGEFDLDVVYKEENARKYEMEPFADLAEDSEFTAKQRNYIISKLTNFYNEKKDNPRANIKDLQEEYLT